MSKGREMWGWSAKDANSKLEKIKVTLPALAPDEIELKVKYCGVCHSDLHIIEGIWGNYFPVICGHEMVGEITELGTNVNHLQKGQIVGVGWQRNSCGRCEYCINQHEQCCEKKEATCLGAIGGFAEYHRTKANFAIPIPDGFPLECVGPLMCGGITTFTPFMDFGVKPYHRIAVVGIGGLGHLALKWGVAWGCEVGAFSTSADKEAEVKGFGVHHFIHYSQGNIVQKELAKKLAYYFDFIFVTIPFETSMKMLVSCLKKTGNICFLAMSGGEITLKPASLYGGSQRSVVGSNTGSIRGMQIMLDFALRHKIYPMIEIVEMDKINEALDKLRKGHVRYRLVLKA
jgi:uncharacterized zinc-type alcohol dehydrogenase-like protein